MFCCVTGQVQPGQKKGVMQYPVVPNEQLDDPGFMQALYARAVASLCYSDTEYLRYNPDVGESNIPPFVHCCRFAARENRIVSPYFTPSWYHQHFCASDPACHPVAHFFTYGVLNGLKGNANAYSPELLRSFSGTYFTYAPVKPFLDWPWKGRGQKNVSENQHHLFCIVHEASLTGAPLSLLQIMQELAQNQDVTLWTLLLREGELTEAFGEVSQVLMAKDVQQVVRFPLFGAMQLARGFASLPGNKKCLLPNTITVPKYYSTLFSLYGSAVVPWVHEQPGFLPFYWKNNDIAELCLEAAVVMTPSRLCAEKLSGFVRQQRPDAPVVPIEQTGLPIPSGAVALLPEQAKAYRRSLGVPATGALVLGCGAVSLTKGTDIFARIAALVTARRADVCFAWAGKPLTKEDCTLLERLRQEAAMQGTGLVFLGEVASMWPLYACASLLLCTSRFDSFPRVVIEAKEAGLPVVCLEKNNGAVECLTPPGDGIVAEESISLLAQSVESRIPPAGDDLRLPVPAVSGQYTPATVAARFWKCLQRHAFSAK